MQKQGHKQKPRDGVPNLEGCLGLDKPLQAYHSENEARPHSGAMGQARPGTSLRAGRSHIWDLSSLAPFPLCQPVLLPGCSALRAHRGESAV